MHIARYALDGTTSWGFVREGAVYSIKDGRSLQEAITEEVDLPALEAHAASAIPLSEVELLAPIRYPPQFIGIGLNYRRHVEEAGLEIPGTPLTFPFYASSIANPGQAIVLPPFTDKCDWEVELGVIIGVGGRDIEPEDALDHIAGYTIINDVSARDIQAMEGQWSRAKSFDSFKPMGPWITTTDELGTASDLTLRLWVNDDLKQSSSTSDLIFDVPSLVSFVSQSVTLQSGSVISTGTPSGVGFAREPAEYLQPGDLVTLEIEGIGRLTSPVVASQ